MPAIERFTDKNSYGGHTYRIQKMLIFDKKRPKMTKK